MNKKLQLDAVVFDCDGVLIESNEVKTQAFALTVAEEYGEKAGEQLMAYHRENGGISRFKKFEWFFRKVVQKPLTPERMDTLCDRFGRLCFQGVMDAPMVPGAGEALDFLNGKIPLFVASGTPGEELRDVIQQRGLSHFFNGVLGTPPEKKYLLAKIIAENGFDASKVLMVGDADADLEAAQDCHTHFYGRGERLRSKDIAWGDDLTGLVDYLMDHFSI